MKTFKETINESNDSDKLAGMINTAIDTIDDSMSYKDFAAAVAKVLVDDYGTHLYEPFMKELKKNLK